MFQQKYILLLKNRPILNLQGCKIEAELNRFNYIQIMYDYSERVDRIWNFVSFIGTYVGHRFPDIVHGTLDEEIEYLRTRIRELFTYFMVSTDEELIFRSILSFDDSVGTYNSHLACLENCADRLGIYANLSHALRRSFFTDDDSLLLHADLELKHGEIMSE